MREKIAKRLRRELLRKGCVIESEHFVKEAGCFRKDCGYCLRYRDLNGYRCLTLGFDMLDAYRLALWGLKQHPKHP